MVQVLSTHAPDTLTLTISEVDKLSSGDILDVRARCTSNDTTSITPVYANFNISSIGGLTSGITIDLYTNAQINANFLSANTSYYTQSAANT